MALLKRELIGVGPLGEAEAIVVMRDVVAQASMDCVLAARALATARARYQSAERADPPLDRLLFGRISGTYVDASKRDRAARLRWQNASKQLVELLERQGGPL